MKRKAKACGDNFRGGTSIVVFLLTRSGSQSLESEPKNKIYVISESSKTSVEIKASTVLQSLVAAVTGSFSQLALVAKKPVQPSVRSFRIEREYFLHFFNLSDVNILILRITQVD